MNPVRVVSVQFRGKARSDCVLGIDETNRELAVSQTRGALWRKGDELLFTLPYNDATTVRAHGRFVEVDDLTVEAQDEATAAMISSILVEPRQKAQERRHSARRDAEYSVGAFLKDRAAALSFLDTLKTNPRGAFFSLSSVTKGAPDPFSDWRRGTSAKLAKALQEVDSTIARVEELGGHDTAQRLYALTYLVGQAQNALAEGDRKRLEGLEPLAADLDIDVEVFKALDAGTVTERLLDAARINLTEKPQAAPAA